MPDKELAYKIIAQKPLQKGHFLHCEQLTVESPDGNQFYRERIVLPDGVAVLPLDRNGTVHLIRQYRAPVEKTLIEIPAGLVENGEKPLDCGRRGCEEERGIRPGRLISLGKYIEAEGFASPTIHLFIGVDLVHTGKTNFDEHEYCEPVSLPFHTLLKLVHEGEIQDSKTIITALKTETIAVQYGLL